MLSRLHKENILCSGRDSCHGVGGSGAAYVPRIHKPGLECQWEMRIEEQENKWKEIPFRITDSLISVWRIMLFSLSLDCTFLISLTERCNSRVPSSAKPSLRACCWVNCPHCPCSCNSVCLFHIFNMTFSTTPWPYRLDFCLTPFGICRASWYSSWHVEMLNDFLNRALSNNAANSIWH